MNCAYKSRTEKICIKKQMHPNETFIGHFYHESFPQLLADLNTFSIHFEGCPKEINSYMFYFAS